jgi:hypothetical protein
VLQEPGDEQDDDDAPEPRRGEGRLLVEAYDVLKEVFQRPATLMQSQ